MEDDDYSYFDSLQEGGTASGNQPRDSNHGNDNEYGTSYAFAAVPPEFATNRPRFAPSSTRNQRLAQQGSEPDHVESYWKDGYPVLKKKEWSSVHA
jgi:hypothetical protein